MKPAPEETGWKFPRGVDRERADRFFRAGSDRGFLCVAYDDLTDDEESTMVLWKADVAPVSTAYATTPPWAENGLRMTINASENRLTCLGPVTGPIGMKRRRELEGEGVGTGV